MQRNQERSLDRMSNAADLKPEVSFLPLAIDRESLDEWYRQNKVLADSESARISIGLD